MMPLGLSLHLADGFANFATFFVPAVLLSLADRVWRPKGQAARPDTPEAR